MSLVPGFAVSNEIKVGTRVPVEGNKESQMQYVDVGTSIWSRMVERGDSLQLEVRAEISSFANPEQEGRSTLPLLRQLHISASTVASPGKPTVVGVVDDPNSKRQFQLEVTVTKLR
jgi:type II secretory pathway component GspD/PulD (secretin)